MSADYWLFFYNAPGGGWEQRWYEFEQKPSSHEDAVHTFLEGKEDQDYWEHDSKREHDGDGVLDTDAYAFLEPFDATDPNADGRWQFGKGGMELATWRDEETDQAIHDALEERDGEAVDRYAVIQKGVTVHSVGDTPDEAVEEAMHALSLDDEDEIASDFHSANEGDLVLVRATARFAQAAEDGNDPLMDYRQGIMTVGDY